jgi:hypothetical protein
MIVALYSDKMIAQPDLTGGSNMSDQLKGQESPASGGQPPAGTGAETALGGTNTGLSLQEQFTKQIAEMQFLAVPREWTKSKLSWRGSGQSPGAKPHC